MPRMPVKLSSNERLFRTKGFSKPPFRTRTLNERIIADYKKSNVQGLKELRAFLELTAKKTGLTENEVLKIVQNSK